MSAKVIISRTNISLLVKAIECLTHHKTRRNASTFEGNLFDLLSLFNSRSAGIGDPLSWRMANLFELEEYARETEDEALLTLINLIEDYGKELSGVVK